MHLKTLRASTFPISQNAADTHFVSATGMHLETLRAPTFSNPPARAPAPTHRVWTTVFVFTQLLVEVRGRALGQLFWETKGTQSVVFQTTVCDLEAPSLMVTTMYSELMVWIDVVLMMMSM